MKLKNFASWVYIFMFCPWLVFASPIAVTFQSRIIKPDGIPLESAAVQFRFSITDTVGSCVIFQEDFNSINMSDSKGLVTLTLGGGTKVFPSGVFTVSDAFNNYGSPLFTCKTGGSINAGLTDRRKLVVQFNDGSGWQTVPAMDINSTPYSLQATNAFNLGGFAAQDFLRPSTLNSCNVNTEALSFNGTSFVCVPIGGGGTLTTVSSTNGYLSVANPTTAPTLTVNVGTGANTLAAGDDARITGAAQKSANLSDLASATTSRSNLGLGTAATLNVGTGASEVVQLNGASQLPAVSGANLTNLNAGNISSGILPVNRGGTGTATFAGNRIVGTDGTGSSLINFSCSLNQIISFDVTGNAVCVSLSNGDISNNGNTFSAAITIGTNDSNNLNFETSGTNRMTVLASGNVGIGTTSPSARMQVSNGSTNNLSVFDDGSVFVGSSVPGAVNIAANSNFTSNITGWTNLTSSDGSSVTWQNALSGDGSTGYLRFLIGSGINWDRIAANTPPLACNTSYNISFWYRTGGITGSINIFSTNNFATMVPLTSVAIPNSTNWTFYSGTFSTTASTCPHFGFYKPGNIGSGFIDIDRISIVQQGGNGVPTLNLSSGGNVGLGIAPVNRLDANGSVAIGSFAGTTAPAEGLIVSGNVGIGTASPNYKLDTVGGFFHAGFNTQTIPPSDNVNGGLIVGWNRLTGGGKAEVNLYNAYDLGPTTNLSFLFSQKTGASTASDLMSIMRNGNVGIGTTAPVETLDVAGAIKLGATTSSNAGTIRWDGMNFQGYNGSAWANFVPNPPSSGSCDTTNTYSLAGNYVYTVPATFGTITVRIWGGGGSGGAIGNAGAVIPGTTGGTSSISSLGLTAQGGGGGNATSATTAAGGVGGIASGGDVNTVGTAAVDAASGTRTAGATAPFGGAGGTAVSSGLPGNSGFAPGGGGSGTTNGGPPSPTASGGGSGAYLEKTFTSAGITPGSTISDIIVGAGGGSVLPGYGYLSGAGGDGRVTITCASAGSPPLNDRGVVFQNSGNYSSDANFVFDASGNLGVGTNAPTQKIEVNGGVKLAPGAAKPACNATTRGTFWYSAGGSGAADQVEVCAKDSSDSFAWRTIY